MNLIFRLTISLILSTLIMYWGTQQCFSYFGEYQATYGFNVGVMSTLLSFIITKYVLIDKAIKELKK